ncbi:hypothetical protein K466DRAFT_573908 [Polyporus arcularius HHB13444]|uniref:CRA domain-containing protein n=1 Tax=Polyporus arcularius HHB13444 TaxID=1314778 RepID=A0A5C3PMU0_9APHY|nr:hypothetical protein K466DRAFT_573908 [Polyporus arcularius HHB13444]
MPSKAESSRTKSLLFPAPQELRELVLDYLVHNSFNSTAESFVSESSVKHVDADGDEVMRSPERTLAEDLVDLRQRLIVGDLRKDIRTHILTGKIDEAKALLNKHFPSVLSEDTEEVPTSTSSPGRWDYLPSTSVNPEHLALNLRIQAFIEAARTIPLPYYPPGSSTPLPHPPLLSATTKLPPEDEDTEMLGPESEEANEQLLHRVQGLYSDANALTRAEDRARYLHELKDVGGLLAYIKPENSPLAAYMTQRRREGIADQIDGAILYRAKRPAVSRIELYARYTATLWGMLHEKDVKTPPRSTWPAGVSLPPSAGRSPETTLAPVKDTGVLENAVPAIKKPPVEKEAEEVLPPFDLHLFVESPERP